MKQRIIKRNLLWEAKVELATGLDAYAGAIVACLDNQDRGSHAHKRKDDAIETIIAAIDQVMDAKIALIIARLGFEE